MSDTQHTPGPWVAGETLVLTTAKDYPVADLLVGNRTMAERTANARLIAAAPELLEALEWALGVIETCELHAHNVDWSIGHFGRKGRAQSVIAKARGAA